MDLLDLKPGDYAALASWLESRADELDDVMPKVLSAAGSVTFEGSFARKAKASLRTVRGQEASAADALRSAARVARARGRELEQAQAQERQRRGDLADELRRRRAEELSR